jgi:hypothetical protein
MYFSKILENFDGEIIFLQNKLGFYPVRIYKSHYQSIEDCNQYYDELYKGILDVEGCTRKELKHIYILKENDLSVCPNVDKLIEETNMFHYIDDQFIPFAKRVDGSFDEALMPQTD